MRQVDLVTLRTERFGEALDGAAYSAFEDAMTRGREVLAGRRLWHVNSAASGGGVAEILRPLTGYQRGGAWDAGWLALDGDESFFAVTKRIHNHLHGVDGSDELGSSERASYERVLGREAVELRSLVRAGDLVLLHDPQSLGLAPALAERGADVVWACHVGIDEPNEVARRAWRFLSPYLEPVRACIFSRPSYAWSGIGPERLHIVPPAIDPFSAKNQSIDPDAVGDVLRAAGILEGSPAGDPTFERAGGGVGRVSERVEAIEDAPVPASAPAIVQISRWDRLKDHVGVMRGFASHVPKDTGAHVLLVGPRADAVSDDPEQEEVLRDVVAAREALEPSARSRTHIVCMPDGDAEASHAMVNALQRHAAVVVQKSLAEGFGLTVAEGMWKARPVVASRVGGIQDQIEHRRTGLLIDDPRDLEALGSALTRLLEDPAAAESLGRDARERVRERFLLARYMEQLVDVMEGVRRLTATARGTDGRATAEAR